ncbi:MAG: hypothetical protein ACRCW9_10170 [Cetobacterium sp.]
MIKTILSKSVVVPGYLHLNSYDTGDGSANEVSDEILLLKIETETSFKIITKYANKNKLPPNAGYVTLFKILGSN